LAIRQEGGTLVRLGDVADVVLGADNYEMDVRMSGARATFMGVWVLPNANALDVIKRVREEMAKIQSELPTGLSATIAFDATKYIDSAIHEVRGTLIETICIVIVVIFLFLGSLRTVVVPVVAIPVSLIGAVFLMQVFGFSLNLLTLLAIVLSVGLVVDDAIVVVENVDRHMREGHSPFEASMLGARELVGPIIAMTITLAAVYAPIGFQGGLTGALFREFVFTLAGAVLISGVVALTLSPMMSSRLLQPQQHEQRMTAFVDRVFQRIKARYSRMLASTLANRPAVYIVWGVLSLLVVPMYLFSAKELAPTEDQGVVFGKVDTPANATMEQVTPFTEKIFRNFQSIPEFSSSFQITFPSGGFGGMIVKPWEERTRNIFQLQQELFGKQMMLTGVQAPVFLPPALPSSGIFPVEFVIASTGSHEELVRAADKIVVDAIKSGQFAFPPVTDVKIDQAKAEIVFDREKMASMGLSMQQVGADLGTMLGGNYVNRFNMEGRSYKVIAQVERAGRLTPTDLGEIHVTGPGGTLIPLSSIATFRTGVEPRSLNRFQQLNAVKISGVAPRGLEQGLAVLEAAADKALPAGSRVDYTGESRQLRQEAGKFLPAMGLAIVLIFLVLAAQFNSFRDPVVVLAGSVPPGMKFALTEGWTTTLNIYSQVGLVTLVGLIAKNGILVVEFANHQQESGLSKVAAVQAAAETRLRPILMTTIATVAGHFPLTLVSGPGAAARNPTGVVLVGGMAIGTIFTLFVVPSVYVLVARDHRKTAARKPELALMKANGDVLPPQRISAEALPSSSV
jgi:multidrug efflux pump